MNDTVIYYFYSNNLILNATQLIYTSLILSIQAVVSPITSEISNFNFHFQ